MEFGRRRKDFLVTLFSILVILGLTISLFLPKKTMEEKKTYSFSFEEDLGKWQPNGTDLDNPPVNWTIKRSQRLATKGDSSVRFYLDNVNDAGKIWIGRFFKVEPNEYYEVRVSYDFASADYGSFNLWKIITGAYPGFPERKTLGFQGDTGIGPERQGFKWLKKNYTLITRSSSDGKVYVNIGVWGTYEVGRAYFLDNVKTKLKKLDQSEVITEEESLEVAREFVKDSPTYAFDGFNLTHEETLYPDIVGCNFCYTFVFSFKSRHAGYGNRTGQILAQVITPHEAHVTVEDGKITQAMLDMKWDMKTQEPLGGGPPKQ